MIEAKSFDEGSHENETQLLLFSTVEPENTNLTDREEVCWI